MTRYIPGDVVKTKWGNAIVLDASEIREGRTIPWHEGVEGGYCSYSVSHMPGYIPRIWENGVGHGPKYAWYNDDELLMVAPSAARSILSG